MAANDIAPTKSNLVSTQKSLELAVEGFSLLDKKRAVLIREMMSLIDDAKEIGEKIGKKFEEAYSALAIANITLGINSVEHIAMGMAEEREIHIRFRSIMGVEIPVVEEIGDDIRLSYGFYRTNPALDRACSSFQQVLALTAKLAEVETAVFSLAGEIKKTQKRANALDHILIPRYREWVKYIQDVLEEKEREDFFRLKVLKQRM